MLDKSQSIHRCGCDSAASDNERALTARTDGNCIKNGILGVSHSEENKIYQLRCSDLVITSVGEDV